MHRVDLAKGDFKVLSIGCSVCEQRDLHSAPTTRDLQYDDPDTER